MQNKRKQVNAKSKRILEPLFAKDIVSGGDAMSPVHGQSPTLINYVNNGATEQQKPYSAAPGQRRKVMVSHKPAEVLSEQRDQNPGLSSKQSTNFTHAPPLARA